MVKKDIWGAELRTVFGGANMDESRISMVTPLVSSESGDKTPDERQQAGQLPRYTDALTVRVYEEDEASYECCRTY